MRRPSGLFSSPATTPRLHHSQGSGQHLQRRRAIRITFTVLVSSYLLAAVWWVGPHLSGAAHFAHARHAEPGRRKGLESALVTDLQQLPQQGVTANAKPAGQPRGDRPSWLDPNTPPQVTFTRQISYEPFSLPVPKFIDPAHRAWYFSYFYPQQRIAANAACPPELAICGELRGDPPAEDGFPSRFVYYEPQFLRGQLDVISQGHLSRNFDCGWGSNHSEAATFVRSPPSATPARSPAAVAQPTAEPSNQLSGSNGRVSATAQLPMTFAGQLQAVPRERQAVPVSIPATLQTAAVVQLQAVTGGPALRAMPENERDRLVWLADTSQGQRPKGQYDQSQQKLHDDARSASPVQQQAVADTAHASSDTVQPLNQAAADKTESSEQLQTSSVDGGSAASLEAAQGGEGLEDESVVQHLAIRTDLSSGDHAGAVATTADSDLGAIQAFNAAGSLPDGLAGDRPHSTAGTAQQRGSQQRAAHADHQPDSPAQRRDNENGKRLEAYKANSKFKGKPAGQLIVEDVLAQQAQQAQQGQQAAQLYNAQDQRSDSAQAQDPAAYTAWIAAASHAVDADLRQVMLQGGDPLLDQGADAGQALPSSLSRKLLHDTRRHTHTAVPGFSAAARKLLGRFGWGTAGFLPGVTVPTLFGSPATTSWVSGKLLFLAVPDGWSFQHFVDGALPKLVQAKTFIQAPEVKILMDIRSLVPIVGQLLKRLGVDESRALWSGIKQYVQAEELMLTCVTPPFHPQLWREAQAMLGVNQLPRSARSVIAYITRNAASGINGGRVVAKEAELLDAIRALLASRKAEDRSLHEELVVYRHERYRNLEDDLAFWAGVKAVIGPHGGAFTNMVFVPQGALVIEFFPVDVASNRPPYPIGEGNPGHMYQTQAAMLEHDYYFIKADSRADLMEVDSKQVVRILADAL